MLIVIALVAGVSGFLATLVMIYSVKSAERREKLISRERQFYESEIVERVERLLASPQRWQDVNHLLIDGQQFQSDTLQVFDPRQIPMLIDLGLDRLDLSIDPELVFVLAPVSQDTEQVYETIVRAAEKLDLRTNRADLQQAPGGILRQIVQNISISRVIVADVSTRNPNVYYELGIAHALGKPTILVSKNVGEVGFDIAANRLIIYKDQAQLQDKLQAALKAVLAGKTYESGR